ncbi:hypothetical protein [Micromonospora sp. NBC_01796]|uniref:hypothetical protein n=1 Tax=Micromonospora sp. NBC_01796 TaxID=2975987 RepID=UPI002DD93DA7|nr:hypothetical protein [Micromonospora sp. NBC_01796]WSA88804.1 hypothetical protein OIE47_15005 [Micromonospora sp. NBC_01796]
MSRQDEPLTRAGIWDAAKTTLQGHTNGRRCPQCGPDRCKQLDWAVTIRIGGKAASVLPALLAGL